MHRRRFLVVSGGLLAIAGAIPTVSASSVEVDVFTTDLEVSERRQQFGVAIRAEPNAEIDLRIDLNPLVDAGVTIEEAWINHERSDIVGGSLESASVDDAILAMSFVLGESDSLRGQVVLDGLDTTNGEHDVELSYPFAIGEDGAFTHESESFRLTDPAEIDPSYSVTPRDLVIGEEHHLIEVTIDHLPAHVDRVTLDVDIEILDEYDVDTGSVGVGEAQLDGSLIEGVPIETSSHRPIRLTFEPVNGSLGGTIRLGGFDTANAQVGSGISYLAGMWVDDPPDDPNLEEETAPFAIREAGDDDTPEPPDDSPEPDDEPAGAQPMPGFSVAGAVAAIGGIAVGIRRSLRP